MWGRGKWEQFGDSRTYSERKGGRIQLLLACKVGTRSVEGGGKKKAGRGGRKTKSRRPAFLRKGEDGGGGRKKRERREEPRSVPFW